MFSTFRAFVVRGLFRSPQPPAYTTLLGEKIGASIHGLGTPPFPVNVCVVKRKAPPVNLSDTRQLPILAHTARTRGAQMSSSASAAAAARPLTRAGKPFALHTLRRALLSAEPAENFGVEETDDALALFRVLLALALGPALTALGAASWLAFAGALALIAAASTALARLRFDLDDEHLAFPRVSAGEALFPMVGALFVSWTVSFNIALALAAHR